MTLTVADVGFLEWGFCFTKRARNFKKYAQPVQSMYKSSWSGGSKFSIVGKPQAVNPGEKDRVNTRWAWALVSTTRISAEVREILIVQRPVTPKCAGASGSKINNDGVSTFKQTCSGRYLGSLKVRTRTESKCSFLNFDFDRAGSERFGAVPCSNTREIWRKNRIFSTINRARTRSFSPGNHQ